MAESISPLSSPRIAASMSFRSLFAFLPRIGSKERLASASVGSDNSNGSGPKNAEAGNSPVEETQIFSRMGSHRTVKDIFSEVLKQIETREDADDDLERAKSPFPEKPVLRSVNSLRSFRPQRSPEVVKLEKAIHTKGPRHRLVDALLPLKDDLSVKVRFISAVDEFLAAEGKERKEKGAHIVKMFIKKRSMFYLKRIPEQHEQALLASKYECLEDLRMVFLTELAHNELVLKTLEDVI